MAGFRIVAAATAALLAAGCGEGTGAVGTAPPAAVTDPPSTLYRCDNGATVRAAYPDAHSALIDYQGRTWTLRLARSASGARYVTDGLQWWTSSAMLGAVSTLGPGETFASSPGVQCIVSGSNAEPAGAPMDAAPGEAAKTTTQVRAAPGSAQAAANLVQTYFGLIGAQKYGDAWRLWEGQGKASGMDEPTFAGSFAKYASYNANVGAPGAIETAPGGVYVEVPVQIYGRLTSGDPMTFEGSVGLRRPPDAPGVQPQWRIAASDLKPGGAD
jgi:membrane-bound inhibitor of C-type lysozyme